AQLRESQDRLNRAQRLAQLGSFERDLLTGENIPSDEAYRLLGLKKTDALPGVEEFLQRIHPEDRLSYKTALEAAEDGLPVEPIEYRLQAYDGRNKCIRLEMDV